MKRTRVWSCEVLLKMLGNGVDLPKLASFTTDKEAYWSTSFQYPRRVEMESALALAMLGVDIPLLNTITLLHYALSIRRVFSHAVLFPASLHTRCLWHAFVVSQIAVFVILSYCIRVSKRKATVSITCFQECSSPRSSEEHYRRHLLPGLFRCARSIQRSLNWPFRWIQNRE